MPTNELILSENISEIIDQTSRNLIAEMPGPDEEITSAKVIGIIKAASKSVVISGWVIGKLLIEVEKAISSNAEGFEYQSMSKWFDKYEEDLPFKRSAAKVYKNIAENISLDHFAQLGYKKSNTLLGIRNAEERNQLIEKAIEENLTAQQIKNHVNESIENRLRQNMSGETGASRNGSNMYELSVQQWNPFKGCDFGCVYCREESFQPAEARNLHGCDECRDYIPHRHSERLVEDYTLKSTPYMMFIFTCSSGDINFCPTDYLELIIDRIKKNPDKNFLIQSKNPATFNRVEFPINVVLGTTIETNRDEFYRENNISRAPAPSRRYEDFKNVNHKLKMLTLEPIMDFDLDEMLEWIDGINPVFIWLGTVSEASVLHINNLEPPFEKIMELYTRLGTKGYVVMFKNKFLERYPDWENENAANQEPENQDNSNIE